MAIARNENSIGLKSQMTVYVFNGPMKIKMLIEFSIFSLFFIRCSNFVYHRKRTSFCQTQSSKFSNNYVKKNQNNCIWRLVWNISMMGKRWTIKNSYSPESKTNNYNIGMESSESFITQFRLNIKSDDKIISEDHNIFSTWIEMYCIKGIEQKKNQRLRKMMTK